LLDNLADGEPTSSRWVATAKVLKEMLEHHIAEEQTDTFAELGEHFDADQLRDMGVAFLRAKAVVLGSKLPVHRMRKGPRKAPAKKLVRSAAQRRTRRQKAAKTAPRVRQRS